MAKNLNFEEDDFLAKTLSALAPTGRAIAEGVLSQNNIQVPESTEPLSTAPGPDGTAESRVSTDILDLNFKQQTNNAPSIVAETQGPTDRMAPVANPYELMPRIQKNAAQTLDAVDALGTALTQSMEGKINNQQDIQKELATRNATQQVLLDENAQAVNQLSEETKGARARRKAIAERKVDVLSMNPFKRTLSSLFNRNYDTEYLDELDNTLAEQIDVSASDYAETARRTGTLFDIVGKTWSNKYDMQREIDKAFDLQAEQAKNSLGVAQAALNAGLSVMDANQKAVVALDQARTVTLENIADVGTVNTLMAQAKTNPNGIVNVDGAELSVADLRQRGEQLRQRQMALESQSLALQSQKLNLAADAEERLITKGMSPTERAAAAASDGRWNGRQLDTRILAQAIQGDNVVQAAASNNAALGIASGNYYEDRQIFAQKARGLMNRMSMTTGGRANDTIAAPVLAMARRINEQNAQLAKTQPGTAARQRLEADFAQEIGSMSEQIDKQVDGLASRISRNPDSQAVLKGFIQSIPVDAATTARGILGFIETGGLPPGMQGDPMIQAMIAADAQVTARYSVAAGGNQPKGGRSGVASLSSLDKASQTEIRAARLKAITAAGQQAVANMNVGRMINSIPQLAKQDGHPAGRINPMDWALALQGGDKAGMQILADQLRWSLQDTEAVFGAKGAGLSHPKAASMDPAQFQKSRESLAQWQTTEQIRLLNSSGSATPTFRPGDALVDYMKSNNFQDKAFMIESNLGRTGLSGAVAANLGNGAIANSAASWAQQYGRFNNELKLSEQANQQNLIKGVDTGSYAYNAAVLRRIPGISRDEAAKLANAVQNRLLEGQGNNFQDVLSGPEFQDPGLKRVQKIAAKEFESADKASKDFFEAYGQGVTNPVGPGATQQF